MSKRVVDPLNPVHHIYGQNFTLDDTSKPKALPKAHSEDLRYTTRDIVGASPGWKPSGVPPPARRHYRQTNNVKDIEGSTADTYKPYPRTNRQTNPLQPVYTNLDGAPIVNDFSGTPIPNSTEPPRMIVVPETVEGKDREIAKLKEEISRLSKSSVNHHGASSNNLSGRRSGTNTPRVSNEARRDNEQIRADIEAVKNLPATPLTGGRKN